MNFVGVQDDKDEWLKSELPALEQLYAMGYEYKGQSDLNKTRRDYREVLLYDRVERLSEGLILNLTRMGFMMRFHKLVNLLFLIP